MPLWALTTCVNCGAEIQQPAAGRPRRFCCDACRQADYRRRSKRYKTPQNGQDAKQAMDHTRCRHATQPAIELAGQTAKE